MKCATAIVSLAVYLAALAADLYTTNRGLAEGRVEGIEANAWLIRTLGPHWWVARAIIGVFLGIASLQIIPHPWHHVVMLGWAALHGLAAWWNARRPEWMRWGVRQLTRWL